MFRFSAASTPLNHFISIADQAFSPCHIDGRGGPLTNERISNAVPDHRGRPRRPGMIFFAPPPPSIGRLLSAESTLGTGRFVFPLNLRIALAATAGGIILYAGIIVSRVPIPDPRSLIWFLTIVFTALAARFAWNKTGFEHTCTYVGEEGFAMFQ